MLINKTDTEYTYTHSGSYINTHTNTHTHTETCTHTHTHTRAHTRAQGCTHTCTHTHTCALAQKREFPPSVCLWSANVVCEGLVQAQVGHLASQARVSALFRLQTCDPAAWEKQMSEVQLQIEQSPDQIGCEGLPKLQHRTCKGCTHTSLPKKCFFALAPPRHPCHRLLPCVQQQSF